MNCGRCILSDRLTLKDTFVLPKMILDNGQAIRDDGQATELRADSFRLHPQYGCTVRLGMHPKNSEQCGADRIGDRHSQGERSKGSRYHQ